MLEHLFILAVAAMIGLAIFRLARSLGGRSPLPGGPAGLLFILAFLVAPPLVLAALIEPVAEVGQLHGIQWVPLYVLMAAALAIVMALMALVVEMVVPGRPRRLLMLALVGSEGIPDDVADPAITPGLAEGVALVDSTNAVFPRGRAFAAQIHRDGFRSAWDALDAATGTLEGRIADDKRLGLGAATEATATARDARGRLDTLRRLAGDDGQAWAGV